jgi:DNA modification methylase
MEVLTGQVYKLGNHRVGCGDCCDVNLLKLLFNGDHSTKADCVISDPPYNIKLKYDGYEDNLKEQDYKLLLAKFLILSKFITKPKSHVIFTMSQKYMFWCHDKGIQVGLEFRHMPIWYSPKRKAGSHPGIWPYSYEAILDFTNDGYRKLNNHNGVGYMDVFSMDAEHDREHPAQRPSLLWKHLIELTTNEGELIFDPFLGSGTTLIEADKLNRICFGIELSPKYVEKILTIWYNKTGSYPERIA